MATPEDCDDTCVIDIKKLLEKKGAVSAETGSDLLILLTEGTYGTFDGPFNAIQIGNAVLALEKNATIVLLDEGAYFGVKNQDPSEIELLNNTDYIKDFLDLGGRILALEPSLKKRGLLDDDIIEGIKLIDHAQLVQEIEKHKTSLTF
ncbi:MAG: DsrH/TusB family sulfur metabolism protein [Candidatus Bathyarchaeia archaeon]